MALGFAEIPFFSVMAVVADKTVKAAAVKILGIEATGNPTIVLKLEGELPDVEAALEFAEATAEQMGVKATVGLIGRPVEAYDALIHYPNSLNPLFGGPDQWLPTDHPRTKDRTMDTELQALGIIETQGLTAVLEATDAMLKAANVTFVGKEKIGAAYVTVIVKGDVAACKAAVDAGAKAVGTLGKLIAAHVIARPHADLIALLPK
jgi:carbon dioxide concentrating mechanism protein CcmO